MWKTLLAVVLSLAVATPGLLGQNKTVLLSGRVLGARGLKEMGAASPHVRVVQGNRDDRARFAEQLKDADGVIGGVDVKLIGSLPKLKWVQLTSAGAERYSFSEEFRKSPIVLTNCKILQGPEIADHAFALLLTLTRQTNKALEDMRTEIWPTLAYTPLELNGKTAVVVGVGGIGTQIAVRAHAFGMTVIGVDPKEIPYTPHLSRVVPPNRLDTVLPLADVVFISAPLTRESQGMMGAKQFELMKQGAYFVAVSRGGLYDGEALLKALQAKRLAGAGLDVTNPEPLPKGHPLWKFPNVVITPHMAGQSDGHVNGDYPEPKTGFALRQLELYCENIRRFGAGEPLLNVVDKEKGY